MNLVIIKELLLIKAEIDLNYLDVHPSNLEIFGWKLDSPLVIILEVKELKLLNSMEQHELPSLGFAAMHERSSFDFQFTNAGTHQSYGCNDYMPKLFSKYLQDVLLNKDEDNDDTEEIESLGLTASNEEVKNDLKPLPSL